MSHQLYNASERGDEVTVRRLVSEGGDVNARGGPFNATALIMALARGSREVAVACVLLEGGADINAHSDDGRTALIVAADWGMAEMLRELLGRGTM